MSDYSKNDLRIIREMMSVIDDIKQRSGKTLSENYDTIGLAKVMFIDFKKSNVKDVETFVSSNISNYEKLN